MASVSLCSSYKRYKADTDVVSEWLFTTAKKCGFRELDSYDEKTGAETRTPRLKGKARKLARASSAASSNDAGGPTRTYCIKINHFTAFAQCIANSTKPRIQVPDSLFMTLTRAIRTRKSHQAFYYQFHDQTESVAQNSGHTYFIETLDTVLCILRPSAAGHAPSNCPQSNDSVAEKPLSHMFAGLTVEETSESAEFTTSDQSSSAAPKIRVVIDEGKDPRREEAFVASTFLCRDVHRLRLAVQEIWKAYLKGDTGLVAASVATNTAIDFCRKLQEDFDETFPQEHKAHEDVCLYCVLLQMNKSQDERSDDGVDLCLKSARRVVSAFIQVIKNDAPTVLPIVAPSNTALYPSSKSRSCMDDREKFGVDFRLAMGVLPEIYALLCALHCDSRLQAEHEAIRASRNIILHKEQSYWNTFAIQVLLDIRHILRDKVGRGLEDLRRGGSLIMASIKKVLNSHREVIPSNVPRNDDSLRQIVEVIAQWLENDEVRVTIDRETRLEDPSIASHITDFYLLERDPLWCGLLLYSFQMEAHERAIATSNSWRFVLTTSHLYNSLRQTGMLRCEWDDMESIISMHRAENLFVGKLPTTLLDCMKHCALACGFPVSYLARNTRSQSLKSGSGKHRMLEPLASMSWQFKKRFCGNDDRTDLGPTDVMAMLRKSRLANGAAEQSRHKPNISVSDVLQELCLCIHDETAEVVFNHFEMHVTCWRLLRQLHATLRHSLSNTDWSEVYRDDRNLPSLVFYLLVEASEQQRLDSVIGSRTRSTSISHLSKAVELFEDLGVVELEL